LQNILIFSQPSKQDSISAPRNLSDSRLVPPWKLPLAQRKLLGLFGPLGLLGPLGLGGGVHSNALQRISNGNFPPINGGL